MFIFHNQHVLHSCNIEIDQSRFIHKKSSKYPSGSSDGSVFDIQAVAYTKIKMDTLIKKVDYKIPKSEEHHI